MKRNLLKENKKGDKEYIQKYKRPKKFHKAIWKHTQARGNNLNLNNNPANPNLYISIFLLGHPYTFHLSQAAFYVATFNT